MTYKDVVMHKKADGGFTSFFKSIGAAAGGIAGGASTLAAYSGVYLMALLAGIGGLGGWGLAKMTAHGKQDEDTAKKQYENERLKADLGYLSAQTGSEYEAFKNKYQPKPARVLA